MKFLLNILTRKTKTRTVSYGSFEDIDDFLSSLPNIQRINHNKTIGKITKINMILIECISLLTSFKRGLWVCLSQST